MKPQPWKQWERVVNANAIADGLESLPKHWSLTPLRDKQPFRANWQSEPFISHDNFTTWLLDGEKKFSKKSFKAYQAYISGYGLRTGDSSNGLVALDVDGASVEPLLQALSNGDLPKTVSWSSGKDGRRQLLFQVPNEYWQQLADFNRLVRNEHNGVKTSDGEALEIRYNRCQSVLPPSRHPQTGAYYWINSPSDCEVATAPNWLCELLIDKANEEKQAELARAREAEAARARADARKQQRQQSNFVGTPPLEIFLTRDDQDLINSGTGQGNRDNAGFKLAANLIATCDRLQVLGIPFEGDGQGLFEEFAVKCSPALSNRDINRIWKSASKKSKPSLNDDQLEKRFSYWQWQQNPKQDSYLEPDRDEYEKYCQWEAEQERILEAQDSEHEHKERQSLSDYIKKTFNRVAWKFWKRTGELPAAPQPNPKPKTDAIVLLSDWQQWVEAKPPVISYKPGFLPSKEEYQKLGCPKIEFQGGDRKKLLKEIYQKWDKFNEIYKEWDKSLILESSDTGQGKSHDAGNLTSDYLTGGKGQVYYNDVNHRNPSTETVERNFTDLDSRNNGLAHDHERKTASGYPHVVRPKNGQKPDIEGNCPEADTFLLLNQDKNLIMRGGKGSAICEICPHYKDDDGKVACSFILDRTATLNSEKEIRLHLAQSVPGKAVAVGDDKPKKPVDVFIIEEAGASLNTNKNILVAKKDFTHAYQELKQKDNDLAYVVEPLHDALYKLFNVEEMPEYGFDFVDVREVLLKTLPLIYQRAEEKLFDKWLSNGWDLENSTPETSFWRFISKSISDTLYPKWGAILNARQSPEQKQAIIKDHVPLNWISLALNAIAENKAHLRVDHFGLHITKYDRRYRSTMNSYRMVVMLDSTLTRSELALITKFKKSDIVEIRQVKPDYSNYEITIINGIGSCSKKRRAKSDFDLQVRIEKAVGQIHNTHKFIGVIDHQNFANNYWGYEEVGTEVKSGYWGRDNRGSNDFMRSKALALIGTPLPNLGQAAAEYHALTGNVVRPANLSGSYGHYVRSRAKAETYQAIGRSRAHLKPEPTHIYLIGNEAVTAKDLMQRYPGCTVNEVDIYDFCPEAAPKGVQRGRGLVEALINAIKGNTSTGSKQIAAQLGVSDSRVRQLGSEIFKDSGIEGGFAVLKSALVLLIESFNTKLTDLAELPEVARWVAETYLPLLVDEDLTEAMEQFRSLGVGFGWKTFKKILAATDATVVCKLLSKLLAVAVPSLDLHLPEPDAG